MEAKKVQFSGRVIAVKGRIRLLRSFDQISHSYHGYTLVMNGSVGGEKVRELRVAVELNVTSPGCPPRVNMLIMDKLYCEWKRGIRRGTKQTDDLGE